MNSVYYNFDQKKVGDVGRVQKIEVALLIT
jgi:hypothetical protein